MRHYTRIYYTLLSVLALAAICSPISAQAKEGDVETLWRLLDYIAVDYPGAVDKGKVINEAEFSEMEEFSGTVVDGLVKLPFKSARSALI